MRAPSLGLGLGLLVVTGGVLVGLQPLHDSSFLTHLATGRIILDSGGVPSVDPYTFTAPGEPWVVQSWLVSVLYASAERLGGLDAVRLVVAGLAGAVAGLGWRLTRPADGVIARTGLAAVFVAVGAGMWAERPLMVGLLAFALVVLAAEGGLDPRWLLPLGWVWVNAHGSFPLGLVYLAAAAAGSRLDGGDGRQEARCALWAAGGMLTGAVGPLGLTALTFPVELLRRRDALAHVIEWQAPTFTDLGQQAFLLQLVVAIVLLARRPSWRAAMVLGVFAAAALLGSRNVTVASIALLPAMAAGLRGVGSLEVASRSRSARGLLVGAAAASVVLVGARLQEPPLQLAAYPVAPLALLEEQGVDTREVHLAGPEPLGNLTTYVYGPDRRVFFDDRFDMFPEGPSIAHRALADAHPTLFAHLARYDVTLVTTRRSHPSAVVVTSDPAWRVLYTDEHWMLACQRGVQLSAEVRC
jgi:hypothetical protein